MAPRLSMTSVFVIALAALFATPAMANDQSCTRETIGRAPVTADLQRLHKAIEAIFDAPDAGAASVETTTDGPSLQMIVVRVKDGKPVMACVDNQDAATRFLTAPIEKIRGKAAEDK